MAPIKLPVRRVRTALALSIAALAVMFFILPGRVRAQAIGNPSVSDVNSCGATSVTIARTPYQVRRQEQLPAGTSVKTLDGVFQDLAPGLTFHVTHVSGQFFGPNNQMWQARLYKDGQVIEAFNVDEPAFHTENSTIYSRTLNQPVDLNFAISADPGQYDLQIIRSGSASITTGIVEFWGYLTSDTCPIRG